MDCIMVPESHAVCRKSKQVLKGPLLTPLQLVYAGCQQLAYWSCSACATLPGTSLS